MFIRPCNGIMPLEFCYLDSGSMLSTWEDSFLTSRPIAALNADGTFTTLGQVLSSLLPHIRFESPGATKGVDGIAGPTTCMIDGSGVRRSSADHHVVFKGSPQAESSPMPTEVGVGHSERAYMDQVALLDPPSVLHPLSDVVPEEAISAGTIMVEVPEPTHPGSDGPLPIMTTAAPLMNCQGQRGHALVCGITPPLASPVAWLHSHLHGPDYFLYIVVLLRDATA
jgi:hypothetical protein